jgi:Zn-dependent M28 family amino/carboxypeptidase
MAPTARPIFAALLGLTVVLGACGIAPPPVEQTVAPDTTRTPAPSFAIERIRTDAVAAHLDALEAIAEANGGLRTTGTTGYDASVDYVAEQLRDLGYEVETPEFQMPGFRELPGATIAVQDGPTFRAPDDFHAMIFSDDGRVTARLATVGYPESPGGEGGRGCRPDDWDGFPEGAIAVAPPGPCLARTRVELAQEAGAVAVVLANPAWLRGEARRPTLLQPDGIDIPALSAIGEVGEALREAAEDGAQAEVSVRIRAEPITGRNVIAHEAGPGGADRVVMLGGHLDSVHDGPGLNDNGSGVAALLEIARVVAEAESVGAGTIRFGFWGGEEFGLYGSRAYVEGLTEDERDAIVAYLNLDMLGSVNGVPYVYRESGGAPGSDEISDFLADWLEASGIGFVAQDLGGGSDHASFAQAGIPTGGIFSGATEHKTDAQASEFGGSAEEPMDPCYHLACDTAASVDPARVAAYAQAAAAAAIAIASGVILGDG